MKKYIMGILLLTVVSSLIGFAAADSPNSDNYQVTIYVNSNTGLDTNDGSINHPVKSVRKAIDIAPDYSTIQIANGIYSGPDNTNLVDINKNLKFVGESKEGTIFDANGADKIFATGRKYNNVSFESMTLKNSKQDSIFLQVFTLKEYRNFEYYKDNRYVRNCNFFNTTNGNALAIMSYEYTVNGCTFVDNTNRGLNDAGAAGAALELASGGNVDHCTFINNYASNYGGAIKLGNSNTTITSSHFSGNRVGEINRGNSIYNSGAKLKLGNKNTFGPLREPYSDKFADEIAGNFELFTE
jgi:predicted outer membrane repeat protein